MTKEIPQRELRSCKARNRLESTKGQVAMTPTPELLLRLHTIANRREGTSRPTDPALINIEKIQRVGTRHYFAEA